MADPEYARTVAGLEIQLQASQLDAKGLRTAIQVLRGELKLLDEARLDALRSLEDTKDKLRDLRRDNASLRSELDAVMQALAGLTVAYRAARGRLRTHETNLEVRFQVPANTNHDSPDPCMGSGG